MPVCFWGDLVNVEQSGCSEGGGGGGNGELLSYTGTETSCGGSDGRFLIDPSYEIKGSLYTALATATDVSVTGVYQDSILIGTFDNSLDDPLPGYVVFDDVDYPMTYTGGIYNAWITDIIAGLDATYGVWYRIDVDGTLFYCASALTTC